MIALYFVCNLPLLVTWCSEFSFVAWQRQTCNYWHWLRRAAVSAENAVMTCRSSRSSNNTTPTVIDSTMRYDRCYQRALKIWRIAGVAIGADFHRAMVATAPGEKLIIGRRPARSWTQLHWQSMIQMVTPYDIKLVCLQKITFVLRKINENCSH